MRAQLLLFVVVLTLRSAEVDIGGVDIRIPASESHQAIAADSNLMTVIAASTPAPYRLHYVEAPPALAELANADMPVVMDHFNVLMSFTDLESAAFNAEDFAGFTKDVLAGIKGGLEQIEIDEAVATMKKRLSDNLDLAVDIAIENPKLIGEPVVTKDDLRFTMLMTASVNERKIVQCFRIAMRPISERLVVLASYVNYVDEQSFTRVEQMHDAFIARVASANSLVLPNAELAEPATIPAPPATDERLPPAEPAAPVREPEKTFIP